MTPLKRIWTGEDEDVLLLPIERNKLTLACSGPYKLVRVVGEVD